MAAKTQLKKIFLAVFTYCFFLCFIENAQCLNIKERVFIHKTIKEILEKKRSSRGVWDRSLELANISNDRHHELLELENLSCDNDLQAFTREMVNYLLAGMRDQGTQVGASASDLVRVRALVDINFINGLIVRYGTTYPRFAQMLAQLAVDYDIVNFCTLNILEDIGRHLNKNDVFNIQETIVKVKIVNEKRSVPYLNVNYGRAYYPYFKMEGELRNSARLSPENFESEESFFTAAEKIWQIINEASTSDEAIELFETVLFQLSHETSVMDDARRPHIVELTKEAYLALEAFAKHHEDKVLGEAIQSEYTSLFVNYNQAAVSAAPPSCLRQLIEEAMNSSPEDDGLAFEAQGQNQGSNSTIANDYVIIGPFDTLGILDRGALLLPTNKGLFNAVVNKKINKPGD